MIERYFTQHVGGMLKQAAKGEGERYLPWYGSAAAGGLGSMAAQEFVPKKYKIPAAVAGSLAGTVLGVHGGERLGKYLDKRRKEKEKIGEEKTPPIRHTIAHGLAGLGTGMLGGYLIGKGIERTMKPHVHMLHLAPKVMGTAGAVMGASYPLWKALERERIQKALSERRKKLEENRGK